MKKYIPILFLLIFIIPSIALASWWNPLSWKFFDFLHRKDNSVKVQYVEQNDSLNQIKELQRQIDELKNKQMNPSDIADDSIKTKEEIRLQIEKEVKAKLAQEVLNIKDKTLSEQVGVSKDSLTTCIKNTNTTLLQSKINTSVESAMKGIPPDQRGTPYSVVVGSNGLKTEIRGALPYEEIKKIIDDILLGKVTQKYEGDINLIETGDHTIGNINASVRIIEYSDLECPYCKMFGGNIKKIISEYGNKVSWTYRHWPIHQNSFEKLVAAECVAKLKGNDAFWKYIDLLFGLMNTGQNSVTDKL